MRPHQWPLKNAFVLVPLLFAGPMLREQGLLTTTLVLRVGLAALAFCFVSGATYILNDIHDVEADRLHAVKRARPIAAGTLPVRSAWIAFGAALVSVVAIAVLAVNVEFLALLSGYFAMNLAYSKGLKRIAYVDAIVIALGFLLRLLAGGVAANVGVSHWLIGCTVLGALFLALGKRKHELLTSGKKTRVALGAYRVEHLNILLGILAVATAAAYLSYTLDAETTRRFHTTMLPWTSPFALIGLWRFAHLLGDVQNPNSPTERMLRDWLFMANLALWSLTTLAMIYGFFGAKP